MSFDDNHQYIIAIPSANGESQTFFFTPEVLPEQLIPLVQKKQLKEEKLDYSNINSVYKKLLENLSESQGAGNIIDVSSIVNLTEKNKTSNSESIGDSRNPKNSNSTPPIIRNLQNNLHNGSTTFLLQASNVNPSSQNLATSLSNDQTVISENSSNYITTLQISQNSSNLPTLAFNQPQALLHYSKQNQDSTNTVMIPISLQNTNQFTQQQILVATGGYNQNCGEAVNSTISSNSNHGDSINVTSLAKLISSNCSNPLSINLNNHTNKSNSSCSEISPNSKIISKSSKSGLINNEEFGKRKEIRLLKNREAARECRRKKKEYVKCLENRVSDLEEQNKVLVDKINRIKEFYSKKTEKPAPTVHIINSSEMGGKFVDLYSSESAMKDEMFESADPDQHQQHQQQHQLVSAKEKLFSLPGGMVALASIAQSNSAVDSANYSNALKSKSGLLEQHTHASHIILNTAAALGNSSDKDGSGSQQQQQQQLFLKFKKDSNSALSLLLTSDKYTQQQQQAVPPAGYEPAPVDEHSSNHSQFDHDS